MMELFVEIADIELACVVLPLCRTLRDTLATRLGGQQVLEQLFTSTFARTRGVDMAQRAGELANAVGRRDVSLFGKRVVVVVEDEDDVQGDSWLVVDRREDAPIPKVARRARCFVGEKCTAIEEEAFLDNETLARVEFPAVESIGTCAFEGCMALTEAEFPAATSIGDYYAFYKCSKLARVEFPVATSIGVYAFFQCVALTEAEFPAAREIGGCAFRKCSKLARVEFPVVESIGESAFEACLALTEAKFPAATSIGRHAFKECSKLARVEFPMVRSIEAYAFDGCMALTEAEFPAATEIGVEAFRGCRSLKTVTIPATASTPERGDDPHYRRV